MDHLFDSNVPGTLEILKTKRVGLAGCGGLGSNAAVSLVRAGVGKLVLADKDLVEESNLNRQHFFLKDIGKKKVEALRDHLRQINPDLDLEIHDRELTPDNLDGIFGRSDLLIEAFDRADGKQWLIGAWTRLHPEIPLVCGNGLAGVGRTGALRVTRLGQAVYFCGDGVSDMKLGLCAPRVAIVANMEANVAVELLLGKKP